MSTRTPEDSGSPETGAPGSGSRSVLVVLAWAWVLVPFLYGVYSLVLKLPALF